MLYVSTGGIADKPAWQTSQAFLEAGIRSVELSGGQYDRDNLARLKLMVDIVNFQVHNYFPPPEIPFVFNLASLDSETHRTSFEHAKKAIRWGIELDRPVYSFHAGFLLDPDVSELGKRVGNRPLFDREQALVVFIESVNDLAEFARQEGARLLIENNVLSANNYRVFGANPFLVASADEARYVMENTSSNVHLLVDVAHLKVSANSLGFDPVAFLEECHTWIEAYHLSDNDGTRDSNEPIKLDSWFWPHLKRGLDYYSLEIYNIETEGLLEQVRITEEKLSPNQ